METFFKYECFPLVILEAMANRLPVISTDEGAISDIVQDGVSGYVVRPRDAQGLANAMSRLLSDSVLRHQMGEAGYARFNSYFTVSIFEQSLITALKSII